MSVLVNKELLNTDDMEVDSGLDHLNYTDDFEVRQATKHITFPWQHVRPLSGKERYQALCQKLGLKPKKK